ncbi:polypeptide N-acetylgalactosaminyltransferase 5-like [Haliotis asinina]|uniref:polypeptide N-acetylgalactosaminyltransferase 5-like n=1 Tax=Haliotis asinina TaxID=109174 RepID=UPI003531A893
MRRSKLNILKIFGLVVLLFYTTRILMQIIVQYKENSSNSQGDIVEGVMKYIERDKRHKQSYLKNSFQNVDALEQVNIYDDGYKKVADAMRKRKKSVLLGKSVEQHGRHTGNTYSVEYFVEEYSGEDINVTYPPFVENSPEDGPGEWGAAYVYKHTKQEEEEYREGKRRNGFNQLVSDRISVHRRLLDTRIEECKSRVYPTDLPHASVIICFHNEAWSTLLRSVHSVLDRSPERLIREIILVDDASTQDHLKTPLKKYMSKLSKVKIVRHRKHQGLIRARLTGYEVAAGPTLVFLDSHIECYPGWLEPLLDRIRQNPKTVPFPMVDEIVHETFHTRIMNTTNRLGVFTWRFMFKWGYVENDRKSSLKTPTDPIRSPTMPGGLFAIDKQWFTTLGTYDSGLLYWGAENLELSFKIWMCNGTLETLPCSHVGHVFRWVNPVKWKMGGNPALTNIVRVVEVWLDEYKHLYYEANRLLPLQVKIGDITARKKLRESLHCHNFRWYIENIYPECPITRVLNAGQIKSAAHPSLCVSTTRDSVTGLLPCRQYEKRQYWQLYPGGVLEGHVSTRLCVRRGQIADYHCNMDDLLHWTYTEDKALRLGNSDKCLTAGENSTLLVKTCDSTLNQRWMFEKSKFQLHNT